MSAAKLFVSELSMVFGRRRNIALLVIFALVPVLIASAVKASGNPGNGGSIFGSITNNGIFAALAALLAVSPLFLPLGISVIGGDSVAGEANLGTLRYLLTVPVGRTRLLAVKFAGILAWCIASVAVVAVSGLIIGSILFPHHDLTLLSGRTVSFAAGTYRLLLVALYLMACIAVIGALGLFVSTMTEVPVAAMAATLTLTVVSQVLDNVPQLSAIHRFLPTHYWMAWIDLLRDPISAGAMVNGLLSALVYVALFLSLAWARFTGKDVTS